MKIIVKLKQDFACHGYDGDLSLHQELANSVRLKKFFLTIAIQWYLFAINSFSQYWILGLKMAVYEVNETFVDFLAVRNEIDETFPSFYNDSMRYLSAAAFGTLKN